MRLVSVDETDAVRLPHPCQDLTEQHPCLLNGQPAAHALEVARQRRAADVLHGDEPEAGGLVVAVVVDLHDVRMRQAGEALRLPVESLL